MSRGTLRRTFFAAFFTAISPRRLLWHSGENEEGSNEFDYAAISNDEEETVREDVVIETGFSVLPSDLFQNIVKTAESNENLNTQIATPSCATVWQ